MDCLVTPTELDPVMLARCRIGNETLFLQREEVFGCELIDKPEREVVIQSPAFHRNDGQRNGTLNHFASRPTMALRFRFDQWQPINKGYAFALKNRNGMGLSILGFTGKGRFKTSKTDNNCDKQR